MSIIPPTVTPKDLADATGWSERSVRETARSLNACLGTGRGMRLTESDVRAIMEAKRCPSRSTGGRVARSTTLNLAKTKGCPNEKTRPGVLPALAPNKKPLVFQHLRKPYLSKHGASCMNEHRTCAAADTQLTQPRSGFDLGETRRRLIAARVRNKGNLPLTMRLSTLIEQLENRERGTGDRAMLDKLIANSVAEIAALTKGDR